MKTVRILLHLVTAVLLAAAGASAYAYGWQSASRQSANLAPSPEEERGAVIQAYAAPTWGWRGWFADHTWIAVKPENADTYTVYEVIGWRLRRGGTAVRAAADIPDRYWFGGRPRLLLDVRGEKAQQLTKQVEQAVESYPWPDQYRAFPGPNSNTFTAWIARQVPQLELKLPWRAVGKGFVRRAADA